MSLKFLRPLVLMQLKDKLDYGYLKSVKKTIAKIGFSILLFAIVCAFDYLLFYVAKLFNIFSLIRFVPNSVVTIIFTIMLILSIFSCTYGLMQSLYFSKDNIVLLTFPVSANMVFISKLIVFYLYELKKAIYFVLPLFLSYGLVGGFRFGYYLWVIFILLFVALIPVVIGALLSIPAMFVSFFLKQQRILRLILIVSISILAMLGILQIINLIPENINLIGTWGTLYWRIQDFLDLFVRIFNPFHQIVILITGQYKSFKHLLFTSNTLPALLIMLLTIAAVLGLCMLIVKPLFYKMASKPFEYKKSTNLKSKQNKKTNSFGSALKKELLLNFRTTETLVGGLTIFAILPISIFLLNKIYLAMNTNLMGQNLTYSFNLLVILLIVLSSSSSIASIFSKEGASGYLNKTSPVNVNTLFIAKMIFNFTYITLSLIITCVILSLETGLGSTNVALLFFTVWFLYTAHLLWSAEMDLMNPQNNQYATTGSHHNNPNETKCNIFAFILAFIYFGLSIILFKEGLTLAWIKLMLVSLAFLSLRTYLYFSKVKVYYKEM